MTSRTSSARAAEKRSACASAERGASLACKTRSRMCSPAAVPPGSRVWTTSRPRAFNDSTRRAAWSDFPSPSPPSNEMKTPVNALAECLCSSVDLDAAQRLVAGAAGREVRPLDELVLELPHVRILRRELDLFGRAGGDLLDRLAGLRERLVLGSAPELDDRSERTRDLRRRIRARDVDGHALRLRVAESRSLPPVVVLQCDHDVRVLRLADDRHGEAEAARGVLDPRPGESERVDLQRLARAVPGWRDTRRAASLQRVGGLAAWHQRRDLELARCNALSDRARGGGLLLGADLVDDDDLGHVVLDRFDHHRVLQRRCGDLHAPRAADSRMGDVAISSDLVRRVHDHDALAELVREDARDFSEQGRLAHARPAEQKDALPRLDHVADDLHRPVDRATDAEREPNDLARAIPQRADAVERPLDAGTVVAAELADVTDDVGKVLGAHLVVGEGLLAAGEACLR